MEIRVDDLQGAEILGLLDEHLSSMAQHSPPESRHALDVQGLRDPGVTVWSAWRNSELLGCGGLKELNLRHGEIKFMRTASAHLRTGVGAAILRHLVAEARRRRYEDLSLETGSMDAFAPARTLYARFGFEFCAPFDNYGSDPNSVFMTMKLSGVAVEDA